VRMCREATVPGVPCLVSDELGITEGIFHSDSRVVCFLNTLIGLLGVLPMVVTVPPTVAFKALKAASPHPYS
jgi:hypothetical protein